MSYKIIPLSDRILVKRCVMADLEEIDKDNIARTKEGLYVPAAAVEIRPEFEVVAIGPAVPTWFNEIVKLGDTVLIAENSGKEYDTAGVYYKLVYAEECLAKLEDTVAEFLDKSSDKS